MDDSHSSPWLALELGRYEQAIQLFSQDYAQSQELRLLHGRAVAYLAANKPRQALTDQEEVVTRTDKRLFSDSDYACLGICHWYLAQPMPPSPNGERASVRHTLMPPAAFSCPRYSSTPVSDWARAG